MNSLNDIPRESLRPLSSHNGTLAQKPENPETPSLEELTSNSPPENSLQNPIEENRTDWINPETQKTEGTTVSNEGVYEFLGFLNKPQGYPDNETSAMPFPVEAMPPEAQDMIESIVKNTGGKMDPALPAITALSALSASMIPRLECLIPGKGWKNGANIYTLVGANSSNGKSDSMDRLFDPIEKFQSEIQKNFKEVILPKLEVEEIDLIDEEKLIREQKKAKAKGTKGYDNFCPEEAKTRLEEIRGRLREIKDEKNTPRFFISDSSETAIVKGINRQKNKCLDNIAASQNRGPANSLGNVKFIRRCVLEAISWAVSVPKGN